MNRILFVDDEPMILQGLKNMLWQQRREWQMTFVTNGEEALAELERAPFDVLVTDIQMPRMSGDILLEQVRARFPGLIRIVLSGHASAEAAMRCISNTHQYLSKPCNPAVLLEVLRKVSRLDQMVSDPAIRAEIGKIARLPSPPAVVQGLQAAFSKSPVSREELTQLVARDIAMSTKVLQVACASPLQGLGMRSIVVEDAMRVLDLRMLESALLDKAVSLEAGSLPNFCLEALHTHAFQVANLAESMMAGQPQARLAYMAAMLHDMGLFIQAVYLPDRHALLLEEAARRGVLPWQIERELFGETTHAEIGAYYLALCGMPEEVVAAIAHHHAPPQEGRIGQDVTNTLYLADYLIHEHTQAPIDDMRPNPNLQETLREHGAQEPFFRWSEQAKALAASGGR